MDPEDKGLDLDTDDSEIAGTAQAEETEAPEAESLEIDALLEKAYNQAPDEEDDSDLSVSGTRPRDENGRFAKKQKEQDLTDQSEGVATEQLKSVQPPNSWPAEDRELFSKLPPALQARLSERESQRENFFRQKSEHLTQLHRYNEDLHRVIEPYREYFAVRNLNVPQVVNHLLAVHRQSEQDPQGYIQWFAAQNGVDLRSFATEQPQVDPALQSAMQEVHGIKSYLTQQQEAFESQRKEMIGSEIKSWAFEQDANGKQLRPYFNEVWADMEPIVRTMRERDPSLSPRQMLDHAYNYCTYGNPLIRKKLEAQASTQNIEKQKAKVQNARKAAVSINGSPGNGHVKPAVGTSIQELLEAAWEDRI